MMRPFLLACLAACSALAQPPSLIRIVRQGNIGAYNSGQASVNVFGMSAIAGPGESWLIEMHDTFASLEAVDQAVAGFNPLQTKDAAPFPDLLARTQTLIASYRPSLSHRANEGMEMFPKIRYLDFAVIRIRLGTEADLTKLLKLRSFSLAGINADRPEIVFEVIAGAPPGTYLMLAPMTSLSGLDGGRVDTPAYAEGATEAAKKLAADTELAREHVWFRIEPRMSRVSDPFASQDPNFWRAQ
jgi:hypothetical protein